MEISFKIFKNKKATEISVDIWVIVMIISIIASAFFLYYLVYQNLPK